jgi:hypothetical protein
MPQLSLEDTKTIEKLIDHYGIDAVLAVLASYCTVAAELRGDAHWRELEAKLDDAMLFSAAKLTA